MSFDQKQMRAFLAILDQGSLGRAAEFLRMGQPNLSRLIGDMEYRLGQKLFERQAKGMVATAAGEVLEPHARQLVLDIEEARDALDSLRGMRRGTARIGAVGALARHVIPGVIKEFLSQFPGARVMMFEGITDKVLSSLHRREIDLLVATSLSPDPEISVIGQLNYRYSYMPFCAADHPLLRDAVPTFESIFPSRWALALPGTVPRMLFDQMVAHKGNSYEPEVVFETDSVDAVVSIVSETDILGWLPPVIYRHAESAGRVRALQIPELTIEREFFVYRRKHGILPPSALQFLQMLPLATGAEEAL